MFWAGKHFRRAGGYPNVLQDKANHRVQGKVCVSRHRSTSQYPGHTAAAVHISAEAQSDPWWNKKTIINMHGQQVIFSGSETCRSHDHLTVKHMRRKLRHCTTRNLFSYTMQGQINQSQNQTVAQNSSLQQKFPSLVLVSRPVLLFPARPQPL